MRSIVARVVGSLLVLLIVATSCSSNEPLTNSAVSPNQTPTPSVENDQTPVPTTSPTATPAPGAPTPTPAQVAPVSGTGTIDNPLPLVGSLLSYRSDLSDAEWKVELTGLVEVDVDEFNDDEGRCLVVVGSITPTKLESGTISQAFTAPSFGVIANGSLIEAEQSVCDTDEVEQLGYGRLFGVTATVGTDYLFYAEILLPESTSEVQALVAGDLPGDDIFYYRADLSDGVPEPGTGSVGDLNADLEPLRSASFLHTDFSGDSWENTLFGILELEASEAGTTCLALLGVTTPTSIEDGTISRPSTAPNFSLLINGQTLQTTSFGCDEELIEELGYRSEFDLNVTVGTAVPFYTLWVFPSDARPTALITGKPDSDDALYYLPEELTELITPEGIGPGTTELDQELQSIDGSQFSYSRAFSEDEWDVELFGLVEAELSEYADDETDQCVVLIGIITPTTVPDGPISSSFTAPEFSLLANGSEIAPANLGCAVGPFTAAGYGARSNAYVTPNTPYAVALPFLLPAETEIDAVIAGDPSDDQASYFEPLVIDLADPGTRSYGPISTALTPIDEASFEFLDFGGDDAWDVELVGLVEVDSADGRYRCVVLLGTLAPTLISEGTISSPYTAPSFDLIASGRRVATDSSGCDLNTIEDDGYDRILDAEVTTGTQYSFFSSFKVLASAELMAIAFGVNTDSGHYFEPVLLDEIPVP